MKNVRTPQGGIFFDSHCRSAMMQLTVGYPSDSLASCFV